MHTELMFTVETESHVSLTGYAAGFNVIYSAD